MARPYVTGQGDFAECDEFRGHRAVLGRGVHRQTHREIRSRVGDPQPGHRCHVEVRSAERKGPFALADRRQHAHSRRVEATHDPSATVLIGCPRRQERLDLRGQGAPTLEGDRGARAGDRDVARGAEQLRRIGQFGETVFGLLVADHLVGRTVAVLHRTQQPDLVVGVALEREHRVNEMLERARACDGVLARALPDQQGGNTARLGLAGQHCGHLTDLGDATGATVDVGGGERLHGVDHDEGGIVVLDMTQHRPQIRLIGHQQPRRCGSDALCAHPDLFSGLLTRDVEDDRLRMGPGESVGDVEQQSRLADPRLARDESDLSRHETTAEDPVELPGAAADPRGALGGDLGDGPGRTAGRGVSREPRAGAGTAAGFRTLFGHRSELLAPGAAADPPQARRLALRAGIGRGVLRHGQTLDAGSDDSVDCGVPLPRGQPSAGWGHRPAAATGVTLSAVRAVSCASQWAASSR